MFLTLYKLEYFNHRDNYNKTMSRTEDPEFY